MSKLSVRLTLLVACIAAIGYASFLTWSSEQHARLSDNSARQFDRTARATTAGIAELRAAQQAYVAVGQGEQFWFARVAAMLPDLNEKLSAMKAVASAPDAATALDDAAGALQDFEQMDKRARDHAHAGQRALASDMVFTDGFDLTKKAGESVERALTAELMARDSLVGGLRRKEAIALAATALAGILALVLMVPIPSTPAYPKDDVLAGLAVLTAKPTPVATRSQEPPKAKERNAEPDDVALPPTAKMARSAEPPVDLGGMAALCVDLARIQDIHALPALLGRAADILQASGIVLWIADPDGRELSPIVVHGYPPQLANRFGTILGDAHNVTASAYRTGLLQTMKADAISNGAVAAPLVTSGGCVGVMAAEMKNGGEQQDSLLAAATIIASQIATLVGPPSTSRARTEAVG